jgi:hypothetical protein
MKELPASLQNSSLQAKNVYVRFVGVHQSVMKRKLNGTEQDALAEAANNASRNGRVAMYGTMAFGALLPDVFPPLGRRMNQGKALNSLSEIMRGRGIGYVVRRNFGARLTLLAFASIPAFFMNNIFMANTIVRAIRSDERLSRVSDEVVEMLKIVQQERQKDRHGIPGQRSPSSAPTTQLPKGSADEMTGAPSTQTVARPPRSLSPPESEFDGVEIPNTEGSWDSLIDDDASPVAPAHRVAQPGADGNKAQPSSWDQIRRRSMGQSQSQAPERTGMNSRTFPPAFGNGEPAQQQQTDRAKAQKEFDTLMERERLGKDDYDEGGKNGSSWRGES